MTKTRLDAIVSRIGGEDFLAFKELFVTYFPRYWKSYVIMVAMIVVVAVTTGASAYLVGDVIDEIFKNKRGDYLIPLVIAVALIFLAKGLSTYWQTQIGAHIANDMVADAQRRLFTHFLKQRVNFFDTYSSDDLIMRVNQGAGAFGQVLTRVVVNGARDAVTVIALLGVMILKDWQLTIICFGVMPLVFLGINSVMKRIKSVMQQEMRTIADLNKYVREIVQGGRVIKSYNVEPLVAGQADEAVENIRTLSNRISALNNAPVPILDTIGGIGIGLTILYAGYRIIYTGYDPGSFMAFVAALLMAQDPARRLSQLRVSLRTSLVGINMVNQVLRDDRSETSGTEQLPASGPGLPITFENVQFGYNGGNPVLKGFNLDVKAGEMVALVGPSGAGKSTVFSLLLRFYDYSGGRVTVGGRDIQEVSLPSLRDCISYVGQTNFIFTGSLRDNLTLGKRNIPEERLIAACQAVGLHDYIVSLPQGYDTPAGELGSLISGGQAQRLNIARAIIKDAPVLLLDEVTSALDADNEELIRAYMHSQMGKKTMLVIAHRLSTIRQADKIALVDSGQVRAYGTHQELIAGDGYYERVAALQLMA